MRSCRAPRLACPPPLARPTRRYSARRQALRLAHRPQGRVAAPQAGAHSPQGRRYRRGGRACRAGARQYRRGGRTRRAGGRQYRWGGRTRRAGARRDRRPGCSRRRGAIRRRMRWSSWRPRSGPVLRQERSSAQTRNAHDRRTHRPPRRPARLFPRPPPCPPPRLSAPRLHSRLPPPRPLHQCAVSRRRHRLPILLSAVTRALGLPFHNYPA